MGTSNRRDVLRMLTAGGLTCLLPKDLLAQPARTNFVLSNGLRVHCTPTRSSYVSAALTLRSRDIMDRGGGLAHILEHTSFTGAAGALTSKEVKDRHRALLHDSNATTAPGVIQWQASFLPRHTAEALGLLAITSLDQKFDVETVASEARVVLQELFLEKYDSEAALKSKFMASLYGNDHPYARETTEAEIAKAKTPPAKLAVELRDYAETIKLPANMDLFLVGNLKMDEIERIVAQTFNAVPFAQGAYLDVPRARVTRARYTLSGTSQQLTRPLSEIKIAWNTGVSMLDEDVTTLVALGEYLDDLISKELREKKGDTYSPEVTYKPDQCSGIFNVTVTSSKEPSTVETRILSTVESLKTSINPADLTHFKDRLEITRLKTAESNDAILNCMVARVLEGGSVEDCDIGAVSPGQIQAAAVKYLPSHQGGYVRAVLRGS